MLTALLTALTCACLTSTPQDSLRLSEDAQFAEQLLSTSLVHRPLPVDRSRTWEAERLAEKVLQSERIDTVLRIRYATDTGKRAIGSPSDPDYATYGSASATLPLHGRNLEAFNRISFTITPQCDGARVTELNLNVNLAPAGKSGKPGMSGKSGKTEFLPPFKGGLGRVHNEPTGAHLMVLQNHQANRCFLEIDELRRDCVEGLTFYVSIKGRDLTDGDSARYTVQDIMLERVQEPQQVVGWLPQEGSIVFSTTGYETNDRKVALMNAQGAPRRFSLINTATGKSVLSGRTKIEQTTLGRFATLDFSSITQPGTYCIEADGRRTAPFRIGPHIWNDLQWRALNFLFCQRCGHPVPGIHGRCHADLLAQHNGVQIPYDGGWHDAGDLSQQTLQTAEVVFSLLEAEQAASYNTALTARLHEEALWGLDFVLRSRFGDGYRASSMGLLIWQDGMLGTRDDIHSVRVFNTALDNFIYAAVEAYAAMHVPEDDALRECLIRTAEEDFRFAEEKFAADGYDRFQQMYEHTYNTSRSQYHATMSWSASLLYQLTGKAEYAQRASETIRYTLECQRTQPLADGTRGFFYRDTTRRSIVHYIHQSREQVYMQALQLLLKTQPTHADASQWRSAMALYANYLQGLMSYTAPYGMIPSGVYADTEYQDTENFYALHLFPPQDAAERYSRQLEQGTQIDPHHYVKRFPVWFNIFNGNNAVALSQAKAAAICAQVLGRPALRDVAQAQMRWLVGENPFAQSMVYGEGSRYPQLNSFSSGDMVGAMPVGIRTIGDTDIPYWPHINNACYKEVWVTVAGKALSVIAEM